MIQLTTRHNPDYTKRQLIRYYAVVAAAHNRNLNRLMQKRRTIEPRWIPILQHLQDFLNIDYRHGDLTDRYEDSRHLRYALTLVEEASALSKQSAHDASKVPAPQLNPLHHARSQWLHERAELHDLANSLTQMKTILEQLQRETYRAQLQTAGPARTD